MWDDGVLGGEGPKATRPTTMGWQALSGRVKIAVVEKQILRKYRFSAGGTVTQPPAQGLTAPRSPRRRLRHEVSIPFEPKVARAHGINPGCAKKKKNNCPKASNLARSWGLFQKPKDSPCDSFVRWAFSRLKAPILRRPASPKVKTGFLALANSQRNRREAAGKIQANVVFTVSSENSNSHCEFCCSTFP